MKNTLLFTYSTNSPGTFANRKYEDFSYPKNPKMCNLILETLLKMRPHYSQSSRENPTPSSGTSPLASIKEAPPPPPTPPAFAITGHTEVNAGEWRSKRSKSFPG